MNINQRYSDICDGASNGTDKDKQQRANLGQPLSTFVAELDQITPFLRAQAANICGC